MALGVRRVMLNLKYEQSNSRKVQYGDVEIYIFIFEAYCNNLMISLLVQADFVIELLNYLKATKNQDYYIDYCIKTKF